MRISSPAPSSQRAIFSKHSCDARLGIGRPEPARPERPVSIRHPKRVAAMHSMAHAAARPPSAPRPPATSSAPARSWAPVWTSYTDYAQTSRSAVSVHVLASQREIQQPEGLSCAQTTLNDVLFTLPSLHRPPLREQQGNHDQVGISCGTVLAAESSRYNSGGCEACLWALPNTHRCARLGNCAAQQRLHSQAGTCSPARRCRAR